MTDAVTTTMPTATVTETVTTPTVTSTVTPAVTPATPTVVTAPQVGADGKPIETPADSKPDAAKVGAPETYADFKLPDGVTLDKAAMETFLPVAKELGLTQDAAQKLVDIQTKMVGEANARQTAEWKTLQDGWVNSAKTDKEFGGKDFDANIGLAKKALEKFGTPELSAALDATGFGNHPELIRMLVRAGKGMSEAEIHAGNAVQPAQKSLAERLFPSQN